MQIFFLYSAMISILSSYDYFYLGFPSLQFLWFGFLFFSSHLLPEPLIPHIALSTSTQIHNPYPLPPLNPANPTQRQLRHCWDCPVGTVGPSPEITLVLGTSSHSNFFSSTSPSTPSSVTISFDQSLSYLSIPILSVTIALPQHPLTFQQPPPPKM